MKGYEKGLSPSKSNANRNLPSSGSVENNENDLSEGKSIPRFENDKITNGKQFISGAPRKKILGEINENPSAADAQANKIFNLDLERSPKKKGSSDGVVLHEQRGDSSVKVYDPLTNYLSPRPQYLRFDPNRRREIFKRFEKELNSSLDYSEEASDEEEWSAEDIADSSLSPPKGGDVNQRNGGMSEEDNGNSVDGYEEEEEIEERGWCLRGILKLILTVIACLLSTSYICSLNSPIDSLTQQAIWDFKDSSVVIKNETLEFATIQLQDHGFFEVEDGGINSIEKVEVDEENYGESDESIEAELLECLERNENEMVGDENEDSEDIVDEAAEFEGVRAAEFEHLIEALIDEKLDMKDMKEVSSYMNLDEDEDNLSMDEAADTEIIGGGAVDSEAQSSGLLLIGAETVESEDASECMLEMEIDGSNQLQMPELSLESISEEIPPELSLESISEEIPMEFKGADDTRSLEELVDEIDEIGDDEQGDLSDSIIEVDEIGDDAQVGMEKSEWNTSTAVGFSAVLIVSASLAIIYLSKKSRSTSSEESELVLKQKLAVEENLNSVLPSIDRKVEFLARAPLSSPSILREAPRELARHIHAPTVELIGEIVVGQPSSRLKNSYEEECNATLSQKRGSLPRLVPTPSQPSANETHTSTSSTSFRSFTTERKISKKEQGGQSREAMIGATPVRRSSRLRNRPAVKSVF